MLNDSLQKYRPTLVWFTGLSGSGKTTSAKALEKVLVDQGYKVLLLDGDSFRHQYCSDLGYSEKDREENIRRAGELATAKVKEGYIVIAAFISPFRNGRNQVKRMVGEDKFFEVYMNASLEECENEDSKGLYRKAYAGEVAQFTGVDSPYEEPDNPALKLNRFTASTDFIVQKIIDKR